MHRSEVSKFVKVSPTPIVLKDPFPTQDRKMIGSSSHSSADILIMSEVKVATRSQDYGNKNPVTGKDLENSNSTPPTSPLVFEPLHIEKPNPDLVIKPPAKGVLCKSAFNPNARVALNYNIVEDLVNSPSVMLALEVLQSCPAQRKLLLSAIGALEPQDSNLMVC